MTRNFTGRHMFATLVAFFAVVIVVNVYMAVSATRTFSGTVVDNSYVASQEFNKWLAQASAQARSGWQATTRVEHGHVVVTMSSAGHSLTGVSLRGVAEHPLGGVADNSLTFVERGPGEYVTANPLPAGRWRLRLDAVRGGTHAAFLQDVAA